jgi:hypothetical protein
VTDLAEAGRFNSRVEADLARLYLESEGVGGVLFDTEINHFYGGLFLPVRLMVLEEDVALAQRLLASTEP